MIAFLVVIHVIVCFVLILVILLQAGRGQGLSGPAFGSGNVQSLFGTRAGDFLTKATSVSAICFLFTCILLNYVETQRSKSLMDLKRPAANLDMDTIKKALEKIKAEQAAKVTDAKPAESAEAAQGAADAGKPAQDDSAQVPGTADKPAEPSAAGKAVEAAPAEQK